LAVKSFEKPAIYCHWLPLAPAGIEGMHPRPVSRNAPEQGVGNRLNSDSSV
jgi:hypothetical protein